MCSHPNDPPSCQFHIPRVVSTADDARALLQAVPSKANGLTLCAGSYGSRSDNDLVQMAREFGPRLYLVHLRNVKRGPDGSVDACHPLGGDKAVGGRDGG